MDSNTASPSKTTIADLNDDCFLEVFKHLDSSDVCAAADVCRRFRLNAQSHFTSPKFRNVFLSIQCHEYDERLILNPQLDGPLDKADIIYTGPQLKLISISKVLRNFGAFIKSIFFMGLFCREIDSTLKNNGIREKKIFHMIRLHCSGTLMNLTLHRCDITGTETENNLRPVLLHLRKLQLHESKFSNFFARMLSLWTPELRALHLTCNTDQRDTMVMRVDDILRQTFLNLLMVTFGLLRNLNNIDIEEFLKRNPQLKKIGLLNCRNVDGRIFQSIATHAPEVEAIQIDRLSAMNDSNLWHVGKLKCLHTLKLCTYSWFETNPVDHSFMPSILHEIHLSNIPLQHLHIKGAGTESFQRTDQLVDAILKITTLKDLSFSRFRVLKMFHIHDICKHLKVLKKLYLHNTNVFISADDLLTMIKYAPNLQSLQYLEGKLTFLKDPFRWRKPDEMPGCIDEYMKMVEIVGQRRDGTRLLIELSIFNPILKKLPKDLTRKFEHILTLAVAPFDAHGRLFFFEHISPIDHDDV